MGRYKRGEPWLQRFRHPERSRGTSSYRQTLQEKVSLRQCAKVASRESGRRRGLALLFGCQLAADQRHLEVAPGVGDLVDRLAAHAVGAMADQVAAQALVEEARR